MVYMKLERAEWKMFQRIILSGSPVKCERHCVRSGVLFNILNGLGRIFFMFGGKAVQGWAAKTGPKLQRILRSTEIIHFDKDEHKMLGLGRNKQLHRYRLEKNWRIAGALWKRAQREALSLPLAVRKHHLEPSFGLCSNNGG